MKKVAPLKSSFMLAAILGLIITTIYTYSGRISSDWGIALGVVFVCMFIAALISMRKAPIDTQLEYGKGFVHAADEHAGESAKPGKRVSVPRPKPKARTKLRRKKAVKKKAPKRKAKKKASKPKAAKKK